MGPIKRLLLNQRISKLPPPQFGQLAFALNPPAGQLPGCSAPVAERTNALLEWAESYIGCGLKAVKAVLVEMGIFKKILEMCSMYSRCTEESSGRG